MKISLAFVTCVSAALAQSPSLSELIQSQSDLSILGDALSIVPDLAKTLSGLKDITILAPTNAAFEALLAQGPNPANTAVTQRDPEAVAALLAYHVLNGTFVASNFNGIPTYVNTLLTQSLLIDDIVSTNVTDGQNVGLVLNGQNATILSGELQSANVVEADIQAVAGITVHKIDEVLAIPTTLSSTLSRLPQVGLTAALGALTATELVETVDTIEDLTIFVPNNDAFLAAASVFTNASVETLVSVLTYHAVAGAVVFASDIANTTVDTVNGNKLKLSVGTDGIVYVDNAKVIFPNIILSNGVAHVIDTVLNPEQEIENPAPAATPTPAFPGATAIGTDIPFTSAASIHEASSISIPAIATTAKFVSAGGAGTTPVSTPAATPTVSEFQGVGFKVKGGLSGAALGLGMALLI